MKKLMRNGFVLLLALLVMLFNSSIFVFGQEEYVPTDPYVVNYATTDKMEYDYKLPYFYSSPHRGSMGIKNLETDEMEYWSVAYKVYNLINTTALKGTSTDFFASIPAYCTDACVSTVEGYNYMRTNLEESTYFNETTAGKLRAICHNSFPYIKDISVIETRANQWLKTTKPDQAPISNLTGAEVIAATQYSIWCVANEKDVVNQRPYSYTPSYTEEDLIDKNIIISDPYVNCIESSRDTTSNNIKMLHEYYMNLDPIAADQVLITDDSIIVKSLDHQKQKDGTFTATVTFEIDATIDEDDNVTVTATSGNLLSSKKISSGEIQTIELKGLNGHDNVHLYVDGGQKANGIFLFTPEGGRMTAQSMIAYDDSYLPCHGETIASCDGNEPQVPIETEPNIPEPDVAKPDIPVKAVPLTGDTLTFFFFTAILLLVSFLGAYFMVKFKQD